MKDIRKVVDIMNRKAIENETKLDCAKGAIQEAAKLARDRGDECSSLTRKLDVINNELGLIRKEYEKLETENKSLKEKLIVATALHQEHKKNMNEKDENICKYDAQLIIMKKELTSKQSALSNLEKIVMSTKKKLKRSIAERESLKKQLKKKAKLLEAKMNETQQKLETKELSALNDDKEELETFTLDLQERLQSSQTKVSTLTKQLHELKSKQVDVNRKIKLDHDLSMNELRDSFNKEIFYYGNVIRDFEIRLNAAMASKKGMEEIVASLKKELVNEKKLKNEIKVKLKSTEQSLLAKTKKTETALQNLCLHLSSTNNDD